MFQVFDSLSGHKNINTWIQGMTDEWGIAMNGNELHSGPTKRMNGGWNGASD